jgi:IS30 family transposase
MATLLKVLNNLADIKSAGGVALRVRTQARFCDAYASWQKGGVENANGRLRRWLPRHLDIDRTSDREIQENVLTTNLTPRKCLGFKTPFQALLAELGKDVQIRFS